MIAIDNWELLQMVNSSKKSKFQPYPRPYKTKQETEKSWLNGKAGNTKNIDPSKVKDFLTKLGHKPQGE